MKLLRVGLSLLALFAALSCGRSGADRPYDLITVQVDPPTATVTAGETKLFQATVPHSTQGVNWTVLESDGGSISTSGLYTAPSTEGTYHLMATSKENPGKSARATATVVAAPVIDQFTARNTALNSGQSTTLTLAFSGGTGRLSPDPGLGDLANGGSFTVTPIATTTYTLTVTNLAGSTTSAALTLTVADIPTVTAFTTTPNIITLGKSAQLLATFTGGTGSVDPEVGSVVSGLPSGVIPTQTTVYTLTVTSAIGQATKATTTLTVVPPPLIERFTSSVAFINPGQTATLALKFTNGTGDLQPGIGAVTSGQVVTVQPTVTTSYTLTVTNPAGDTVSEVLSLEVAPAPDITSFTASSTHLLKGETLTLVPRFANGTGKVEPGVGEVTSNQAVTLTPEATTSYTLTVTNPQGQTASRTVDVQVDPALEIQYFTPTATSILSGESVDLSAQFSGGTGIIQPGGLSISPGTKVTVSPAWTSTYTLTVTSGGGKQVQQSQTITVRARGNFVATSGPIGTSRKYHQATLLADGSVLITGGLPADPPLGGVIPALGIAERYDPTTGTFSPTGNMASARALHAAVRLADGRVLLCGGNTTWNADMDAYAVPASATAELFDPSTGTFTATGSMVQARRNHAATLLADGRVLVVGGTAGTALHFGTPLASLEIWDPATGTFSAVAPTLSVARQNPVVLTLASGQVLIAGGVLYNTSLSLALPYGSPVAERFDPVGLTLVPTTTSMSTGRGSFPVLNTGTHLLLLGGVGVAGTWLSQTETYDPATDRFSPTAPLGSSPPFPAGAALSNGQILVVGDGDSQVFDPAAGRSAALTVLGLPTGNGHSLSPLPDGTILMVNLEGARRFDPAAP